MDTKDYGGGNKSHIGHPVQRCAHGIREIAFCPACDALYREEFEAYEIAGQFTAFTVHVAGEDAALTVVEA